MRAPTAATTHSAEALLHQRLSDGPRRPEAAVLSGLGGGEEGHGDLRPDEQNAGGRSGGGSPSSASAPFGVVRFVRRPLACAARRRVAGLGATSCSGGFDARSVRGNSTSRGIMNDARGRPGGVSSAMRRISSSRRSCASWAATPRASASRTSAARLATFPGMTRSNRARVASISSTSSRATIIVVRRMNPAGAALPAPSGLPVETGAVAHREPRGGDGAMNAACACAGCWAPSSPASACSVSSAMRSRRPRETKRLKAAVRLTGAPPNDNRHTARSRSRASWRGRGRSSGGRTAVSRAMTT